MILHRLGPALVLTVLLLPSASTAQPAGGKPKPVFNCSFGTKQVKVTAAGGNLLYEFGTPGRPDIVVVGNPKAGNVSHHIEHYAKGGTEQLRFRNGPYSYVPFNSFTAGTDGGEFSGLVVYKGLTKLSSLKCKSGGQFGNTFDLDYLPDDPNGVDD